MWRWAALLATAAGLAGCGQIRAPDLLVVHRSGSIPGARLELLISDDGTLHCNGGKSRVLPSQLLLDARETARKLARAAQSGLALRPGPRSVLRYRIRTKDGTVAFSDDSRGQPPAFFLAQQLVRNIARQGCGLPR